MIRENMWQPAITKSESLYVHAMRRNLQFARWCNLNKAWGLVPKWLEEETLKGWRIRDVFNYSSVQEKYMQKI